VIRIGEAITRELVTAPTPRTRPGAGSREHLPSLPPGTFTGFAALRADKTGTRVRRARPIM
jgi:hypothetical protein